MPTAAISYIAFQGMDIFLSVKAKMLHILTNLYVGDKIYNRNFVGFSKEICRKSILKLPVFDV